MEYEDILEAWKHHSYEWANFLWQIFLNSTSEGMVANCVFLFFQTNKFLI